jgi:hypothetical protein
MWGVARTRVESIAQLFNFSGTCNIVTAGGGGGSEAVQKINILN